MKKLGLIAFLFIALVTAGVAQETSNLYKFTTTADAERVFKVLNDELKLAPEMGTKVRDLLLSSAKSQIELSQRSENSNPQTQSVLLKRQTAHIEGNLKNILGEKTFTQYEASKAAIEKKVQEAPKH